MAEQKWVAQPSRLREGQFAVFLANEDGCPTTTCGDDDYFPSLELAQSRADQLNEGEGK